MLKKIYVFLADTRGVTGIEYGFIAGSVGLAVMTGAFMVGQDASTIMETFSSYLNAEIADHNGKMAAR